MDVHQIAVRLAEALDQAGVSYAVGGAIAYGFYGAVRATVDVDLNIFVKAENALPALLALRQAGLDLDLDQTMKSLLERGDARAKYTGVQVDLFVNCIDLHEKAVNRTREVRLAGRRIRILSAEDLALFKMIFFRPKDIEDVKRMVARLGNRFDAGYARAQLAACLGGDDERVSALEEILSEFHLPRLNP